MNTLLQSELPGLVGGLHNFSTETHTAPQLVLSASTASGEFVLARLTDYIYGQLATNVAGNQFLQRSFAVATAADHLSLQNQRQLGKLRERAHFCVHLTSSDSAIERVPQVQLGDASDDERASACLFGLSAVLETGKRPVEPSFKMDGDWYGEQFRIELGRPSVLNLEYCNRVFGGLVHFLTRACFINLAKAPDADEDLHYFGPKDYNVQESSFDGLFASNKAPGDWVTSGQHIGYIYDSASGAMLDEVTAEYDGLITGLRREPAIAAGNIILELCCREK